MRGQKKYAQGRKQRVRKEMQCSGDRKRRKDVKEIPPAVGEKVEHINIQI